MLRKMIKILVVLFISMISCIDSEEKRTDDVLFSEIEFYTPVLLSFLKDNDFIEKGDSIEKGIYNFMKFMLSEKSFDNLKPITIEKSYCKKFNDDNVYSHYWKVDTVKYTVGGLEDSYDEESDDIRISYKRSLKVDSKYYTTLDEKSFEFKQSIQFYFLFRKQKSNIDLPILLANIAYNYTEEDDYNSPYFKNIIMVEVIFYYMSNNC